MSCPSSEGLFCWTKSCPSRDGDGIVESAVMFVCVDFGDVASVCRNLSERLSELLERILRREFLRSNIAPFLASLV